jgi:hypothetical protein
MKSLKELKSKKMGHTNIMKRQTKKSNSPSNKVKRLGPGFLAWVNKEKEKKKNTKNNKVASINWKNVKGVDLMDIAKKSSSPPLIES